jgi:multidrug efflux pump subunit AcrA (membrane-fusion protein)
VAEAQDAYDDAKAAVVQAGMVRCSKETLDAYYTTYLREVDQLDKLGDGGGNTEYYLSQIVPQRNRVAQAKAKYDYCAGYTTYEIETSQATVAIKKAVLEEAQQTLKDLTANAGIDPTQQVELQNKVDAAQITYNKAKQALAGTTLVAPYEGTILSIAGVVGDTAGTGAFISMADLDHPVLEFAIDESDMEMVAVGLPVEVTFDALPKQTFKGKVTRIYPTLSTSGNYQVLKGLVQLDTGTTTASRSFPVGMNATVTIIAGKAENVLLVPLEALRDIGDGQYGVFTQDSSGELKLVSVKVGLKNATYAEIQSGLTAASVVSTGKSEMK